MSTSQKPSCSPEVLAINQATGMVYGGGLSDKGECLVQFDSDGRIVRENVVAPSVQGKNMLVQRIAVDSASGDVLYTNPSSVGRADQELRQKWRTPVDGPAEVLDLGFEPHSNTVYVTVGNFPVISPARVSVLDGGTGSQRGEFSGPGWTSQFAATGDGQLFVAFFNSNDLYALSDGTSTLTKFASLGDSSRVGRPATPSGWRLTPRGAGCLSHPAVMGTKSSSTGTDVCRSRTWRAPAMHRRQPAVSPHVSVVLRYPSGSVGGGSTGATAWA